MENLSVLSLPVPLPRPPGLTEADITQLIADHGRNIYRFILKKVRNPADAEDIFQTTLCEAFRVRASFLGQSQPKSWVYGIATNLIRNHFARNESFRFSFDSEELLDDVEAEGQDPMEIISRGELTATITEHLEAMPREFAETLTLVAEKNHSYEEAARAMGVPIGTVRSRIFRARAYLKKSGSYEMLMN